MTNNFGAKGNNDTGVPTPLDENEIRDYILKAVKFKQKKQFAIVCLGVCDENTHYLYTHLRGAFWVWFSYFEYLIGINSLGQLIFMCRSA